MVADPVFKKKNSGLDRDPSIHCMKTRSLAKIGSYFLGEKHRNATKDLNNVGISLTPLYIIVISL